MADEEIVAVRTVKPALIRNALAASLLGALVCGCATWPQVRTMSEPGLNLAAYNTYDYVPNPGTNRGGYRSLTTRYLEDAVDREMSARGFLKTPDHPQLLINFRTSVRNVVQGSWGPGYGWGWGGWGPGWGGYGWGPGWGGYGWGPGWWGPGPWGYGPGWGDIETYSEGTLTIDVIDAATRNIIWSGSAVSPVSRAALEHPQESVNQTVAAEFARFPRPVTGAAH
ncbi:MAG TPA: DUF4136 domain-containing protein [Steroidobacteraceae bacterium]|nr:DUF4136 domain-containing protein [Steroidobacteraceae bacterium]